MLIRYCVCLALVLLTLGCGNEAKLKRGNCPPLLPNWSKPSDGRSAFRTMNLVAFDKGELKWNGVFVSWNKMRDYLKLLPNMNPTPLVVFDPSDAPSCAAATAVRDEINKFARCQTDGLCGQGLKRDWNAAPGLSGPNWVE